MRCSQCKEEKDESEFNRSGEVRQYRFRECSSLYQKQYRKENQDELRRKKQEYHINGRAENEPRKMKGAKLWMKLKTLGYPTDNYQVLCFNCNCAKAIYGICPHQLDKQQRNSI
jgi:hypothetical protein